MPETLHVAYVLRMFPQASETFVASEIRQLERLGVRISIFSCRHPAAPVPHECVRQIEGPIHYLHDPLYRHVPQLVREAADVLRRDPVRFGRAACFVLVQALRCRRRDLLKRFVQAISLVHRLPKCEVVHLHAHFAHSATQVAMLASLLSGIAFSFTAHARDIYSHDVHFGLLREQLDRAAFAVTVSDYNKSFLTEKVGVEAARRLRTLYNGVDLEKFKTADGQKREAGLVLAVGRLVEKKGWPYLIEAMRILTERGRDLRCEIVGEGELRAVLSQEIEKKGLRGIVRLLGPLAQEQLPARYRRAAAVVMPAVLGSDGNRDALPTVLLEAMACGTPVVASRLTGIPEIVTHQQTGLLVQPADPLALADAIERLLGDADLGGRFGRAARAAAERDFDVVKNVGSLKRMFESAVAATGGRPECARVPLRPGARSGSPR